MIIESFILLAIVAQYAVCRKIPKYRYISPLICLAACMLILFCAVQLDPWSGDRYIVTAMGDDLEVIEVTFDTWQEAEDFAEESGGSIGAISRETHWGNILLLTALPAIGMLLFTLIRDLLRFFGKVISKIRMRYAG